jgi:hypothetical protein
MLRGAPKVFVYEVGFACLRRRREAGSGNGARALHVKCGKRAFFLKAAAGLSF